MKSMMLKKSLGILTISLLTVMLSGCGSAQAADGTDSSVNDTVSQDAEIVNVYDVTPITDTQDDTDENATTIGGPYGEISVTVPPTWIAEIAPVDSDLMMYGLYGLILKPESAANGQIELFCTDSFGVCGTGLEEKEMSLAGSTVCVGTYDGHEHWDFIVLKNGKPEIVAQHTDCSSWEDSMWDEALAILDTVTFDEEKTEGGIGQYIPESEDDTIAVMMSVTNVTPTGLTIHFRQYDNRNTGELIYGEGYSLEMLNGETWEAVPTIIEEWGFNDEGFILPAKGESEIKTDWEWLYGRLSPGTYRITKILLDSNRNDPSVNIPAYPLTAQFIIAGQDEVIETYEVTDADLSEEYFAEDKLVTLVRYYEMSDGTWRTDDNTYKYRLEITGRMGGAVKDSTFVYLSNIEDISFERAYMAAGLSSNMNDYFKPEEAVLVALK